jgi:hypothetical protein
MCCSRCCYQVRAIHEAPPSNLELSPSPPRPHLSERTPTPSSPPTEEVLADADQQSPDPEDDQEVERPSTTLGGMHDNTGRARRRRPHRRMQQPPTPPVDGDDDTTSTSIDTWNLPRTKRLPAKGLRYTKRFVARNVDSPMRRSARSMNKSAVIAAPLLEADQDFSHSIEQLKSPRGLTLTHSH